jgi:hypothetical protein
MKIDKAQKQALKMLRYIYIYIYIPSPVFYNGQLYAALSRASSFDNVTAGVTESDRLITLNNEY